VRGDKEPVAQQGDRLLQIDATSSRKALGDRASEFPSAKLTFVHTHPGLNPEGSETPKKPNGKRTSAVACQSATYHCCLNESPTETALSVREPDAIATNRRLSDIAFKMSKSLLAFARHGCRAVAFVGRSERSDGGTNRRSAGALAARTVTNVDSDTRY
jgi:hypothetical protein